jgi:hypothetical protein
VVALGHARLVRLGRPDRKVDLDLAAGELAAELEADRLEDAEHGPVVGEDFRDEPLDPDPRREPGELLDEPGADSPALELVCDREGCLGERRLAQPHVVGDGHDALAGFARDRAEQRSALDPVG